MKKAKQTKNQTRINPKKKIVRMTWKKMMMMKIMTKMQRTIRIHNQKKMNNSITQNLNPIKQRRYEKKMSYVGASEPSISKKKRKAIIKIIPELI